MSTPGTVMNCQHCGGTLSLNDMTRPNCPFCGQVLPHQARAAEHAVLVNKVLSNQIGAQYPGLAPGQIPQIGHQYGAGMQNMGNFYQAQYQQVNQAVARSMKTAVIFSVVIGGIILLVTFGIIAATFLFI